VDADAGREKPQGAYQFNKDLIIRYAYSQDGKQIAIERGTLSPMRFCFTTLRSNFCHKLLRTSVHARLRAEILSGMAGIFDQRSLWIAQDDNLEKRAGSRFWRMAGTGRPGRAAQGWWRSWEQAWQRWCGTCEVAAAGATW